MVELFAGVGGFRCGLNGIKTLNDLEKPETWKTVWFSQWEPGKTKQWAHDCYVGHFGDCMDLKGETHTGEDISKMKKENIPDHTLLVGGFPCQDYSVAHTLKSSKGIEGKKGVLWWQIRDILIAKGAPFCLFENVDRLIKSPAKQRGRDFGIILACLNELGYSAEWRVINAAEYGEVQRRRRTFIFAYKNDLKYPKTIRDDSISDDENAISIISTKGFFAKSFPIEEIDSKRLKSVKLPSDIVEVSDKFEFIFDNGGYMHDGKIYTVKTDPIKEEPKKLGDIIETDAVSESYFISDERLWYSNDHSLDHTDESDGNKLPASTRQTWQYIKGAKKILRTAANGHKYVFSEGPVAMIDEYDAPARTMLTSESSFNRSTHIVRDRQTGKIRILTPIEAERIQGFPDHWTETCLMDEKTVPMTEKMRYFCMGNALVVPLIRRMGTILDPIIESE